MTYLYLPRPLRIALRAFIGFVWTYSAVLILLEVAARYVAPWIDHHQSVTIPYVTQGLGWVLVFDAVSWGIILGVASYAFLSRLIWRPSF